MMHVRHFADREVRCGDGKRNHLSCCSKRTFLLSLLARQLEASLAGCLLSVLESPPATCASPEGEEVEVRRAPSCLIDPSAHGNNIFPEPW